jgi:predicted O-methyltransferase YrrM
LQITKDRNIASANDQFTMDKKIFQDIDNYISSLFVKDNDWIKPVEQQCEQANIPMWQISANQGKFLQILAKLNNAKHILEIGTLGGYSTIWLAKALPQHGKLITIEMNPDYAAVAQKNMMLAGVDKIVDIQTGNALDILPALVSENYAPFDMIFIDADKPPYAEYLEWSVKLSRPGTLIIADNVIREGKVLDNNSTDESVKGVQRFNKMLAEDERLSATIIQNIGTKDHDGMAIAVVK